MPASSMYRRPLGRSSAHRQALLRNLTTSLLTHESISTTWAKAKEVQPMVEKLITLGKKNTPTSQARAKSMLFQPERLLGKIFGELKERYAERPGGYTRVLRTESIKDDHADSAVICLVDGPRDIRFDMTARTLLRQQEEKLPMTDITASNIRKVTRFRKDGVDDLAEAVERLQLEREQRKQKEQQEFEQKGTVWKFTNELPRADPRWRERRGPGALVRRRIGRDEEEEVEKNQGARKARSKAQKEVASVGDRVNAECLVLDVVLYYMPRQCMDCRNVQDLSLFDVVLFCSVTVIDDLLFIDLGARYSFLASDPGVFVMILATDGLGRIGKVVQPPCTIEGCFPSRAEYSNTFLMSVLAYLLFQDWEVLIDSGENKLRVDTEQSGHEAQAQSSGRFGNIEGGLRWKFATDLNENQHMFTH